MFYGIPLYKQLKINISFEIRGLPPLAGVWRGGGWDSRDEGEIRANKFWEKETMTRPIGYLPNINPGTVREVTTDAFRCKLKSDLSNIVEGRNRQLRASTEGFFLRALKRQDLRVRDHGIHYL